MNHCLYRTVAIALILLAGAVGRAADPATGDVDLLEGWAKNSAWNYCSQDPQSKVEDVWKMVDGVLISKGDPKGYLWTKKEYTDFVLRLEWRVPPEAKPHKGGVLIRTTGEPRIWPKSLEAQINHPDAGDFWGLDGYRLDGPADRKKSLMHKQYGLLTNLAKTAAVEKPLGQWNRYVITADGDTVTLQINGRQVNVATGCDVVAGAICLTAEGNPIEFRNVKVGRLKK